MIQINGERAGSRSAIRKTVFLAALGPADVDTKLLLVDCSGQGIRGDGAVQKDEGVGLAYSSSAGLLAESGTQLLRGLQGRPTMARGKATLAALAIGVTAPFPHRSPPRIVLRWASCGGALSLIRTRSTLCGPLPRRVRFTDGCLLPTPT